MFPLYLYESTIHLKNCVGKVKLCYSGQVPPGTHYSIMPHLGLYISATPREVRERKREATYVNVTSIMSFELYMSISHIIRAVQRLSCLCDYQCHVLRAVSDYQSHVLRAVHVYCTHHAYWQLRAGQVRFYKHLTKENCPFVPRQQKVVV